MIGKNFLRDGKTKVDRTVLISGAVALALFAFLAAGMIGGNQKGQDDENKATVAGKESKAAAVTSELTEDKPAASSWRKSKRTAKVPKGPGVGSIWKTLGALVLVLVLVGVIALACTRLLKKVRMRPQGDKVLELVDVIPLGPKKQVFVVSAYGRKLVVGATADSMNVLSEFGADEIEASTTARPLEFSEKLSEKLARKPRTLATLEVEA